MNSNKWLRLEYILHLSTNHCHIWDIFTTTISYFFSLSIYSMSERNYNMEPILVGGSYLSSCIWYEHIPRTTRPSRGLLHVYIPHSWPKRLLHMLNYSFLNLCEIYGYLRRDFSWIMKRWNVSGGGGDWRKT